MRKTLLALAVAELAILLTLSAAPDPDHPGVLGGVRTAAAQLRGEGPRVDLVQDYIGARRLVGSGDAYPVLKVAFRDVGLSSRAEHRSTHPPTAFMLALPVAAFPWRIAAAIWATLMLAAVGATWWALGASPQVAAALAPATLIWPPAAWSLGQLTPLWLLGLALAWRWRAQPARAGGAVGIASLTKLLPAVSLVPFLVLGRIRVLLGFALVWVAALVAVVGLRPGALERYLHVIRTGGDDQAARRENASLLWAAGHNLGVSGVFVALLLIAGVLVSATFADREWSWWAWCWAGVALLPIAWIYSLLPLLPVIVFCLRRGDAVARALALVPVVVPFLIDPFGLPGAIRLASATACVGIALLTVRYASRPSRARFSGSS